MRLKGLAIAAVITVILGVVAYCTSPADAVATKTVQTHGSDYYGQYGGVKFRRYTSSKFAHADWSSLRAAATAMCGYFIAAGAPGVVASGACVFAVTHTFGDFRRAFYKIRNNSAYCLEMRWHYANPLTRVAYARTCAWDFSGVTGSGGGSW